MNKDKLIKNEQVIRNRNRTVGRAIKKYVGNDKSIATAPIEFICECSDTECQEPITVTIAEYERLHKRNDRFLIVKGHKSPSVEKTIDSKGDLELVEKPELAA